MWFANAQSIKGYDGNHWPTSLSILEKPSKMIPQYTCAGISKWQVLRMHGWKIGVRWIAKGAKRGETSLVAKLG